MADNVLTPHTYVAMGLLGMSWGALIGGEVTDFMLILNTQQAVDSFKSNKQVSLGAEMSLAIGPLGRTGAGNMTAHAKGLAPIYSYSHSRGLFAGISLEGAVLSARQDGVLHISLSLLKKIICICGPLPLLLWFVCFAFPSNCNHLLLSAAVNLKFYGYEVRIEDLLSGAIEPPNAAQPLYHALYLALSPKETQLTTSLSTSQISSTPGCTTDVPISYLSHESI